MNGRYRQHPPALLSRIKPPLNRQTLHSRISGAPPFLPLRLPFDVIPRLLPQFRRHEQRAPGRPSQPLRRARQRTARPGAPHRRVPARGQ